MEALEGEYKKVRKALEFVIELVEDVGEEDLKRYFKDATPIFSPRLHSCSLHPVNRKVLNSNVNLNPA